jgi:glycosyltransferase involved in cell wall biosynthesis
MKVYIIYHKLFDLDGNKLTIGGIQSYLLNLSKALIDNDITPIIYQLGNTSWKKEYKGIVFYGVKTIPTKNAVKISKHILKEVSKKYVDKDLVIWGADGISVKNPEVNSISIQHGIGFDYIPNTPYLSRWILNLKLGVFYKYLQRRKSLSSFLRTKNKVCVDYNYLNWVRTMLPREQLENISVIPNFTHINTKENINLKESDSIKILFARRFSEERGVLILIEIIDKLLIKYNHISFTVAGEGPYAKLLHEKYDDINNVVITKYEYSESLDVHSKHHLAIIPTYGSEGTSLSLLEAMTSGCVSIASNVGGMTNIILDHYNGFLVDPTGDAFIKKLSLLIENDTMRLDISNNAKKSVDIAFRYEQWVINWLEVIKNATS